LVERFQALFLENSAKLGVGTVTLREIGPVFLAQGSDQCVASLLSDFAIAIAHAIVEALRIVLLVAPDFAKPT
jgi:hypothetical protein